MPRLRGAAVALIGLTLATVLASCDGSDAPAAVGEDSTDGLPTASVATTSAPTLTPTPPVAIATVTVQVPEGEQTERLLLVEGTALFVQEPDGARREVARFEDDVGSPAFPAWSPDGKTIAVVVRSFFRGDGEADFGDDVYLVPATGGEPRLVRPHATRGEQVFGLAWRPGGSQLLLGQIVLALRNGIPTNIEDAAIIEFDLESSGERRIVERAYDPSLSADGTRLSYVAIGELPTQASVVAANADGSEPVTLAEPGRFEVTRYPRIAPDGNTVVLTAAAPLVRSPQPTGPRLVERLLGLIEPLAPRRAEAHGIPMDLWLIDSRTAAITRLTAIGEDDPYPSWSSDGETITFIGTNGLYEASAASGDLVRIGEGRFDGQLAVAPD